MSIDFATLQGLTIPEGVVTQIADASGRVLWALSGGKVILEVEKITSDTYAGGTTYTSEQFILLSIYPKTNGTVTVTYGGLTKTITDTSGAEAPNAQDVFFGTFNGVSDSVETPASGELTIEGDYVGFAVGDFNTEKSISGFYIGIKKISSLGNSSLIPMFAFNRCVSLENVPIPFSVKQIGAQAFAYCTGLTDMNIPASVEEIGVSRDAYTGTGTTNIILHSNPWRGINKANILTVNSKNKFYKIDGNCLVEIATNRLVSGFLDTVIPNYIEILGDYCFSNFSSLTSITIPASVTSIESGAFSGCTGLVTVNILATTPPTVESYTFADTTCTFIVPKGCGDAYKAAESWSELVDRITEAT